MCHVLRWRCCFLKEAMYTVRFKDMMLLYYYTLYNLGSGIAITGKPKMSTKSHGAIKPGLISWQDDFKLHTGQSELIINK